MWSMQRIWPQEYECLLADSREFVPHRKLLQCSYFIRGVACALRAIADDGYHSPDLDQEMSLPRVAATSRLAIAIAVS